MSILEIKDIIGLIDQIKKQIYSISSKQIMINLVDNSNNNFPHEEAYIYEHLSNAFKKDFEKIKEGIERKERLRFPNVFEREIAGTKVKITATHRSSSEEIYGVDLIYEIENKKVVGFQHKKADRENDLRIDSNQLNKIKRICPACEWYLDRPKRLRFFHPFDCEYLMERYNRESYVRPGCSSLYVINSPNLNIQGVVSACRLRDFMEKYNKNDREIFKLVKLDSIDEAFVKCIIGYDLSYEKEGRGPVDNQYDTLFIDQHLIFDVLLSKINDK